MNHPAWSNVERLDASHDASQFRCGLESVDEWFWTQALDQLARVSTHVCLSAERDVLAFYSFRHIIVSLDGASNTMRRGAEVDGSSTGLLLAQMGVHVDHQGNGMGKALLRQAMRVAADLHDQAPFRLLVLDAENEGLVDFYQRVGFKPLAGDLRLVMKMSAVHRLLSGLAS